MAFGLIGEPMLAVMSGWSPKEKLRDRPDCRRCA
jgi:hypothetical protein